MACLLNVDLAQAPESNKEFGPPVRAMLNLRFVEGPYAKKPAAQAGFQRRVVTAGPLTHRV